jgi:hypothetical protein
MQLRELMTELPHGGGIAGGSRSSGRYTITDDGGTT